MRRTKPEMLSIVKSGRNKIMKKNSFIILYWWYESFSTSDPLSEIWTQRLFLAACSSRRRSLILFLESFTALFWLRDPVHTTTGISTSSLVSISGPVTFLSSFLCSYHLQLPYVITVVFLSTTLILVDWPLLACWSWWKVRPKILVLLFSTMFCGISHLVLGDSIPYTVRIFLRTMPATWLYRPVHPVPTCVCHYWVISK